MQPNSPTTTIPFTLVIPAYNEERRLPQSILDIKTFFANFNIPYEVIVVVEKSKDRTVEFAKKAIGNDAQSGHFRVIANQVQRGKGYAVKCGMTQAQGELVFFMDADLSTPLAEVISFLGHFSTHPEIDVIIGSRAHAQSLILKKQSWMRRNMGRTFNFFVQLFGIPGIEDTQCGFKAFRLGPAHEVFSRQSLNGFAFDVEVLLLADRLGYKIDVLPVRWVNSADSKVNMLIDPIKMLFDLIKIRRIVRKTVQARPLSPSKLPSP
jgi:dolichyl-phosphate beta-glucosyltransferase